MATNSLARSANYTMAKSAARRKLNLPSINKKEAAHVLAILDDYE